VILPGRYSLYLVVLYREDIAVISGTFRENIAVIVVLIERILL